MQNVLALQALELGTTTDAYGGPAVTTVSIQCCSYTYAGDPITTIIG